MTAQRKSVHKEIVCVVFATLLLALGSPVQAQHAEDKLIVPGDRIAGLRLASRLADIEAVHGKGQPVGPGQWEGSIAYGWTTPGLHAVVAGTSGNL